MHQKEDQINPKEATSPISLRQRAKRGIITGDSTGGDWTGTIRVRVEERVSRPGGRREAV